jgi:putative solute:sodium symporter small subunit
VLRVANFHVESRSYSDRTGFIPPFRLTKIYLFVKLCVGCGIDSVDVYCETPEWGRKNMTGNDKNRAYWRKNLQYLGTLLAVWFIVSYGCAILFVNYLDKIKIGGFRLGFWFAQQGSIYIFVLLIFIYVKLINRLDKRHDVDEEEQS